MNREGSAPTHTTPFDMASDCFAEDATTASLLEHFLEPFTGEVINRLGLHNET
jgi:hypothetical protein